MIRFRSVSKVYPRTGAALEDVTFHLRKGEFAFLTGPSGAGKSTLLRLIHFQILPTEGDVQVSRYHSARIKRRDVPDLRRRVGFVFQDFKLLERLTAAENVGFALEVIGTPRREIDGKVQRLLSQVGLAAKARSRPSELSGGERQRVVVARALATDPLVLLADEPTGNLDPRAAEGIFQLFRTINRLGMTVLMATHDADLVRGNPNVRVLELEHGRLVFDSAAAPEAAAASGAAPDRRTAAGPGPVPRPGAAMDPGAGTDGRRSDPPQDAGGSAGAEDAEDAEAVSRGEIA